MQGGNADNRTHRARVLKERLDGGQCTYCPPHRGENETRRHNRWVDGRPVKRKNKEQK